MNVLLTGAAGFIGSHLAERLLANGHTVIGLDNLDPFYDISIKRNNLSNFNQHPNFRFVMGDICQPEDVEEACKDSKIDIIVHLAAKAGVRPSILSPVSYQQVNVEGTTTMLEAARHYNIKKFIFASSSSVYGNNEKVPFAETDNVDFPISPYAATKKAGELLCFTYSHLYNIDMSCLRFFTVYGPRQRPDLAIHKFARLILDGKPIPVYGDGSMRRDFTYIDDIIDGVTAAMDKCSGYNIYNLGESQPVRLDRLIAELENAIGKQAVINRLPLQPGDVNQTYADVTRARNELGYNPSTDLTVGLKHFADWLKDTIATQ